MKQITSLFLVLSIVLAPNLYLFDTNKALAQEEEAVSGALSAATCLFSFNGAIGSAAASVLSVPTDSVIDNAQTAGQNQKDCILDSIGFVLKELLIKEITASTVRWINGGFEGRPQYVQDLGGFLEDTADAAIGEIIYNDENWDFLCSGIRPEVRLAAALNIYSSSERDRPRCTLSEAVDAIGDLSVEWDWDNYNEIVSNPANSALGGYLYTSGNIVNVVEEVLSREVVDLDYGDGFLSHKVCEEVPAIENEADFVGPPTPPNCRIVTPGSVINDQINSSITSDQRRIELADEFNEVFGALVGQLIKRVLGDDGLESVSRAGTGTDGGTFLDDYEDEVSIETLRQILEQAILQYESYLGRLDDYDAAIQSNNVIQAEVIEVSLEGYFCYVEKEEEILSFDPEIYQPWLLSTQDLSRLTLDVAQQRKDRLEILVHEGLLLNGLKAGRRPPSSGGHQFGYDDASYQGRLSPDYNSPDRYGGPTEDVLTVVGEGNPFVEEGTETYWSGAPLYALDDIRNWGINALRFRVNQKIEELRNFDFEGNTNEAGLNELIALSRDGLDPELGLIPPQELSELISDIRNRESIRRGNLPESLSLLEQCGLYTIMEEVEQPITCDPSVFQCAGSDSSSSSSDSSGSSQEGPAGAGTSSSDSSGSNGQGGPVGGSV